MRKIQFRLVKDVALDAGPVAACELPARSLLVLRCEPGVTTKTRDLMLEVLMKTFPGCGAIVLPAGLALEAYELGPEDIAEPEAETRR